MEPAESIQPPSPAIPAPAAPTPPGPDPTPPPPVPAPAPVMEPGGNVSEGPWYKSVDWLSFGLVLFTSLALFSVTRYYQLKIRNLKTEIPDLKDKVAGIESDVNNLDQTKMDKKPQGQSIGLGGL